MRCIDEKKFLSSEEIKFSQYSSIIRSSPDLWFCYCDNHLGKLQNPGRENI